MEEVEGNGCVVPPQPETERDSTLPTPSEQLCFHSAKGCLSMYL